MQEAVVDYHFFRKSSGEAGLGHLFHLIFLIVLITIVSTLALFYSLGYQINWAAHSIAQTGIFSLKSSSSTLQATVIINNEVKASRLPLRLTHVFPGQYSVTIKKDGYQSWSRIIDIKPNKVAIYKYILLIRENPVMVNPDPQDAQLLTTTPDNQGIEVRENELWIDNQFITRTSQDIVSASWFPDHQHIVYQVGTELLLAEPDGSTTEKLLTIKQTKVVPFAFKNNGQILVYKEDGITKSEELYNY